MYYSYDWFQRHIPVPRETFSRLEIFHDLLKKWQKKINLISSSDTENIWDRHILDSAQIIKFIPPEAKKITDLGSGAGFPGLILSIMGVGGIELVESDQRKVEFLREAARVTEAKVTITNKRIEELKPEKPSDVITARACANIQKLLELSTRFMGEGSILCFPKGKNYISELEEAGKDWRFDVKTHQSITDHNGVIVIITEAKNKNEPG